LVCIPILATFTVVVGLSKVYNKEAIMLGVKFWKLESECCM
jgi:hypothetical protein